MTPLVHLLSLSFFVLSVLVLSSRTSGRVASAPNPADDCALRQLALDYITFIQPNDIIVANWTKYARDALILDRCNSRDIHNNNKIKYEYELSSEEYYDLIYPHDKRIIRQQDPDHRSTSSTILSSPSATCTWQVYVDGTKGNDNNDGSINAPFLTILHALDISRSRDHSMYPTACITIRQGTYYLGNTATSYNMKDSSRGAISLTNVDNGLTIQSYNGETVVLSGGVELNGLVWKSYKGNISYATIPAGMLNNIDRYHFNELYVDGKRAIRAKYPNGDPSINGLWNGVGWISSAQCMYLLYRYTVYTIYYILYTVYHIPYTIYRIPYTI